MRTGKERLRKAREEKEEEEEKEKKEEEIKSWGKKSKWREREVIGVTMEKNT